MYSRLASRMSYGVQWGVGSVMNCIELYRMVYILYIVVQFPVWRPEWRPKLWYSVQYAGYASQLRGYCTVSRYASQIGVPNGVPNWRPEWRPKLGVRIRVPNWASRYASRMSYLLRCHIWGWCAGCPDTRPKLGVLYSTPGYASQIGGIVQYPVWRPE